jgi:CubicO group peptidase (beta-lactamase class C family)
VQDEARGGLYARAPRFEGGAGGLVSTADDMVAFGRMMLQGGSCGRERVLSRTAVALMTADQLTAEQKEVSPFFPHFWDTYGWGLGLGVVTRRSGIGRSPGSFGWDGAFGTSCWIDPEEDLVGVLMVQRAPATLAYPALIEDFWTSVVQAIDD